MLGSWSGSRAPLVLPENNPIAGPILAPQQFLDHSRPSPRPSRRSAERQALYLLIILSEAARSKKAKFLGVSARCRAWLSKAGTVGAPLTFVRHGESESGDSEFVKPIGRDSER